MAGPRSLSRSTKVAAPGSSRKHAKGKGKHLKKKAPLATWDHDNSSADESVDEEPSAASTASTAASAGKKRPRAGAVNAEEVEAQDRDSQEADNRILSGVASKRQRAASEAVAEEEPASGSDEDIGGSGEGRGGEGDGGGAAAAPTGGMGDVMARILGQKLDARVQVRGVQSVAWLVCHWVSVCTAVAGARHGDPSEVACPIRQWLGGRRCS